MGNNEIKNKNLEAGLENFLDSFSIEDEETAHTEEKIDDKNMQNNANTSDTKDGKNEPQYLDSEGQIKDTKFDIENPIIKEQDNVIQVDEKDLKPVMANESEIKEDPIIKEPGIDFFDNFNEVFGDTSDLSEQVETANVVGEPLFSTFEIADELGITPQTIRNYTGYFKEFLNIERDERGHAHYSAQDVETLKLILDLRNEKKLSKEKIKAYLLNEGKVPPLINNSGSQPGHNNLSKEVMTSFADYLTKLFTDSLGGLKGEVDNNFSSVKELLGSMKETISSQETIVKEQSNIISTQKEEIKRLNNVISSIKDMTRDNKNSIKSLIEDQKSSDENTRILIGETRKEIKDLAGSSSDIDYNSLKKELSNEYKNNASKISEKLNENKQAINNISKSIEHLSNADKNDVPNLDVGKLKQDINNSIEKKYQALYKDLKNDNTALLTKIEELLSHDENDNGSAGAVTEELKAKFDKAEKTIHVLAEKNSELSNVITSLQDENSELKKKLAVSTELIRRLGVNNAKADNHKKTDQTKYNVNAESDEENEFLLLLTNSEVNK